MEIPREIQVDLSGELTYAHKGETLDAKFLTIKCPSNKVLKSQSIIESEFLKAIQEAQKMVDKDDLKAAQERSSDDEGKIEGAQVVGALLTFADINICYDNLKFILDKNALVNGEEKFVTKTMWDEMSIADTKKILGDYIVNFIQPSLML